MGFEARQWSLEHALRRTRRQALIPDVSCEAGRHLLEFARVAAGRPRPVEPAGVPFRATVATMSAEAGATVRVQDQLGHTTPQMALRGEGRGTRPTGIGGLGP